MVGTVKTIYYNVILLYAYEPREIGFTKFLLLFFVFVYLSLPSTIFFDAPFLVDARRWPVVPSRPPPPTWYYYFILYFYCVFIVVISFPSEAAKIIIIITTITYNKIYYKYFQVRTWNKFKSVSAVDRPKYSNNNNTIL